MSFKPLNEYNCAELTEDQGGAILLLTLDDLAAKDGQPLTELDQMVEHDHICKIINKRVTVFGEGKLTSPLAALISVIAEGNPGKALMLAHAVHKVTPIGVDSDIERFVHTFPSGFPDADTFSQAWDGQKDCGGNLIDTKAAWLRQA